MRQLWTRAAVIALTAGTLAACETTSAPQYPARDGQPAGGSSSRAPTPNFPINQTPAPADAAPIDTARQPAETIRREPIPVEPAAPTYREPPVTRTELPPPAAQPTYTPPPAQIRPAAPTIVTTVTGPVVNVPGKPQVRVVESGDALDAIARGFGTTRADLVKLNELEPPYRLKLGQKIKGPAKDDQKAYVVQTGDTMFAIAKRFNVTAAALADENDLKAGAAIKKGQKLVLPDGYKDKGPIKTAVAAAPTTSSASSTGLAGAAPTTTPSRPFETPRPTPTASAPPPAAVTSASTTTTTLSVTGSVVSVAGPRQVYTVKSGDTLTAIAKRFDMTVKELADANDIDTDKPLKLGAKVKGPATTSKAYVAQSGDTLTAIAKRFNVSVKDLAAENDLKTSAAVKKGQKVVLPDGFKDKGPIKTTVTRPAAPTTTVADNTPAPSTPSSPVPYTPSNRPTTPPPTNYPRPTGPVAALPTAPSRPIIESSAPPTEAEIIAAGKGKFSWPLRGDLISSFGSMGTGQRNDGLNIRAAAGAPILASADGEVAYAGNQVPAFGNLVLVKHADGWVTAYAHLATTAVKMRQKVSKGDQLGTVGSTGGVNEPQLHFEMRYAPTPQDKARPVDPALVLPRQ